MTTMLRDATVDDLAGVVGVFLACWRESYRGLLPDDAIEAMTDERADALWRRVLGEAHAHVVVAERDGEILGVTRFAVTDDGGAVHSLYVSPRARGLGLGTRLLAAAEDACRAVGVDSVALWVFAANTPSIGFYRSRGWLPDGTERTQEEFGEPEVRLRKAVSP